MSPTTDRDDQTFDVVMVKTDEDDRPMTADHVDPLTRPAALSSGVAADLHAGPTWRDRLRAVWNGLVGGIGLLVGLLPHVLHHVTFLAGTALVADRGVRRSSVRWGSSPPFRSCYACADGSAPGAHRPSGC